MKRLNENQMLAHRGGDLLVSFCAGLGITRIGVAGFNYLVGAGFIGASALATGGGVVIAVASGCAVYGFGRSQSWW